MIIIITPNVTAIMIASAEAITRSSIYSLPCFLRITGGIARKAHTTSVINAANPNGKCKNRIKKMGAVIRIRKSKNSIWTMIYLSFLVRVMDDSNSRTAPVIGRGCGNVLFRDGDNIITIRGYSDNGSRSVIGLNGGLES
jgi:hypothetical protein